MWKNICIAVCFIIIVCPLFAENVVLGDPPAWLFRLRPDLTKIPPAKEINSGYYMELIDNQVNVPAQNKLNIRISFAIL